MPIRPYTNCFFENRIEREAIDEIVYACERRARLRLPDDIPFEEWARLTDMWWEESRTKWPEYRWSHVHCWIEQYIKPKTDPDPKWGAAWVSPNIIVAGVGPLHRSWTLHEIAHAATHYQNWYAEGHGKAWRDIYLKMLNEFYPEFGRILAEEFDATPELNVVVNTPALKAAADAVEVLSPVDWACDVTIETDDDALPPT